jgi:hypothetical protein
MVKQDSRERPRFPPQQAWSEQDCDSCLLVPSLDAKSKQQYKNNNNTHNTMVTAGYPIPGIDFRGCTLTFYSAFSVSFPCLQRHWSSTRTLARAALASSPVFISFASATHLAFVLYNDLFVHGIQFHLSQVIHFALLVLEQCCISLVCA